MIVSRSLAIATVVFVWLGVAVADSSDRPVFEASYEMPFAQTPADLGRPQPIGANFVAFRVWKGDKGGGDVLAGHLHGSTLDCWSSDVHFCIHHGYMAFVVPRAVQGKPWSRQVDDQAFTLVSRQKIWFGDRLIDTMTVRSINTKFQTRATYFVYNYEIGLIAFATFGAEDVRPTGGVLPDILQGAAILASEHGLGGRENCRHWKCGAMP